MKRLRMIGIALMLAVLTATAAWRGSPTEASEIWCWDDPVLQIGNQTVSLNLGVRQRDVSTVTGAEIVVAVPEGVPARLVYNDTTYFTPVVRFVTYPSSDGRAKDGKPRGSFLVYFDVYLTATRNFNYQIEVKTERGRDRLGVHHIAWSNQHYPFFVRMNGN